jgi:Ca2+-binding RTX toxin-like protein
MAKIKGTKRADILKGLRENDKIKGLAGNDDLLGKGGKDGLSGGFGSDYLNGGGGKDKLKGGGDNDILNGGGGGDRLDAGAGDDGVFGGKGNDVILAGIGLDQFSGGAGTDTIDYTGTLMAVSVDLHTGVGSDGAAGDTFVGVENAIGTAFSDELAGNSAGNRLVGGAGMDHLGGREGNDRLEGGDGDDLLESDAGADAFIGGAGLDTVFYDDATSRMAINLANGNTNGAALGDTFDSIEKFFGTKFDDVMLGDGNGNLFYGQSGNDVLIGKGGNDVVSGGEGADIVDGGDGDDRILAGESNAATDSYVGGKGNDWIDYDASSEQVAAFLTAGGVLGGALGDTFNGIENVRGSRHLDNLQPGVNGRAYGNDGNDSIYDSTGTEVLRGGRGMDTLSDFIGFGDKQKDVFFLEKGMGRDTIVGFTSGVDQFWLSEKQFGALKFNSKGELDAGNQVVNIVFGPGSKATIDDAQLIFDQQTGVLWYDEDGMGGKAPVDIAKIDGPAQLMAKNFVVVPDA